MAQVQQGSRREKKDALFLREPTVARPAAPPSASWHQPETGGWDGSMGRLPRCRTPGGVRGPSPGRSVKLKASEASSHPSCRRRGSLVACRQSARAQKIFPGLRSLLHGAYAYRVYRDSWGQQSPLRVPTSRSLSSWHDGKARARSRGVCLLLHECGRCHQARYRGRSPPWSR